MKAFLFLILILVNSVHLDGSYGIEPFLDEIINNGVYDLLIDLKCDFGYSVAIEACLNFYQTNDCEQVVILYISDSYCYMKEYHFDCTEFGLVLKNYLKSKGISTQKDIPNSSCGKFNQFFTENHIKCQVCQN